MKINLKFKALSVLMSGLQDTQMWVIYQMAARLVWFYGTDFISDFSTDSDLFTEFYKRRICFRILYGILYGKSS